MRAGEGMLDFAKDGLKDAMGLDKARGDMEATFMKAGGVNNPLMGALSDKAIKLGTILPETTANLYTMMSVLGEMKTSPEEILGGVADAVANLAVVTHESAPSVARSIAEMRNSLGLSAADMVPLADTLSRAHFMGANLHEMTMGLARMGGHSTSMRKYTSTLEGSKESAALIAALIPQFHSPEMTGTGLGRLAQALVNPDKANAIGGQFADAQGNFLGWGNAMKQFKQMKGMDAESRRQLIQTVAGEGTEAGIMSSLITMGESGFKEMLKRMEDQASLQERVDRIKKEASVKWQVLQSTLTDTAAFIFMPLLEHVIKPVIDAASWLFGEVNTFLTAHTGIAMMVSVVTVAVGGLIAAFGGLITYMALFGTGGMLTTAMAESMVAIEGIFAGVAVAAWPVTLAIAGIAVAGLLIWKYWQPIKALFEGVFEGIGEVIGPVWAELKTATGELMVALKPVVDWFKELTHQTSFSKEELSGWKDFGRLVGEVIGSVIVPMLQLMVWTVRALTYWQTALFSKNGEWKATGDAIKAAFFPITEAAHALNLIGDGAAKLGAWSVANDTSNDALLLHKKSHKPADESSVAGKAYQAGGEQDQVAASVAAHNIRVQRLQSGNHSLGRNVTQHVTIQVNGASNDPVKLANDTHKHLQRLAGHDSISSDLDTLNGDAHHGH